MASTSPSMRTVLRLSATMPRLRIMRLLLAAHPAGITVGEIQEELGMAASTLSHHLEKLKNEDLAVVRRDRQFLWYSANTTALKELLAFLYSECCTRNQVVPIKEITQWKPSPVNKT